MKSTIHGAPPQLAFSPIVEISGKWYNRKKAMGGKVKPNKKELKNRIEQAIKDMGVIHYEIQGIGHNIGVAIEFAEGMAEGLRSHLGGEVQIFSNDPQLLGWVLLKSKKLTRKKYENLIDLDFILASLKEGELDEAIDSAIEHKLLTREEKLAYRKEQKEELKQTPKEESFAYSSDRRILKEGMEVYFVKCKHELEHGKATILGINYFGLQLSSGHLSMSKNGRPDKNLHGDQWVYIDKSKYNNRVVKELQHIIKTRETQIARSERDHNSNVKFFNREIEKATKALKRKKA